MGKCPSCSTHAAIRLEMCPDCGAALSAIAVPSPTGPSGQVRAPWKSYFVAVAAVAAVMYFRAGPTGVIVALCSAVLLALPGIKYLRLKSKSITAVPLLALALYVICEMILDGIAVFHPGRPAPAAVSPDAAPIAPAPATSPVAPRVIHNVTERFSLTVPAGWVVRENLGDASDNTKASFGLFQPTAGSLSDCSDVRAEAWAWRGGSRFFRA